MIMVIEIKKTDSPEEVKQKLKNYSDKVANQKNARLEKLFGAFHIKEDPVKLQRRWRDEW